MLIDIKMPSPGESINELVLARWFVEDGQMVKKDQEIAEIESEKASLSIISPENGKLKIIINGGSSVAPGTVVCSLQVVDLVSETRNISPETKPELNKSTYTSINLDASFPKNEEQVDKINMTPLARQMAIYEGFKTEDILKGIKKLGKAEMKLLTTAIKSIENVVPVHEEKEDKRVPMSQLRKKLSQRLVKAKNETAMLTTFNEVDMTALIGIRDKFQTKFKEKHGIKLGFMSFFARAVTIALKEFPMMNSMIDGEDIVEFLNYHIGIAVQTPKGLMVPVVMNLDKMNIHEIEKQIFNLAQKARDLKIGLHELTGATFTITNGGVFGSLFSTPILNYPQASILGMHAIVDRPVAINGKVEIRPMMYLALSYDHRIIDGRDSVGFLIRIKELIENPMELMAGGNLVNNSLGL